MNIVYSALFGASLLGGADPAPDAKPTHAISETVEADAEVQTKVHLVIRGKIRAGDGEESLAGQALLEFGGRVIKAGADGLAEKEARYYTDARAKFVVGKSNQDSRQLRTPVRFVVADREKDAMSLWSPGGPFTSDERELIEDVLDTTRLPGLLPHKEVAVGESWEPDHVVVQALCDYDNFVSSTIKCTLEKVEAGKATVKVVGLASGLALGTEVKSKIDAVLTYDTIDKLITEVTWTQVDGRAAGPISPAGAFEVKMTITRSKAPSKELADDVIASVKLDQNPASKLIVFEAPQGRYRFFHDRQWSVNTIRDDVVVLRRMDGSEFVAQLNVTALPDRAAGAKMTLPEFQQHIESTAEVKIAEVLKADNLPTDGSFTLQMLAAKGTNGTVELIQKHYLATSPTGKQLVFSFVFEPHNEEKMGTTDLSMVSSVEFAGQSAKKDNGATGQ